MSWGTRVRRSTDGRPASRDVGSLVPRRSLRPDGPAVRLAAEPATVGSPLDAALRVELESQFGHDFGKVRLHTDARAAAAAAAHGAQALTSGGDITFAAGRYAPGTAAGRKLIAHELAHVVQQARGGTTPDAEQRADRAASRAMRGETIDAAQLGGAPVGAQAKPDEPDKAAPDVDIVTGADAGAPAAAPSATVLDGFVRDKSELTKKHLDAIDQLAFSIWLHLSLNANARASISIFGHTDTTGREKHNSGLGAARAEHAKAALEAALQKQQIDPAKLAAVSTSSFGETRLRVPTADEVDEPRNRRVEIEVTIEVKAPPRPKPPSRQPLPGTPGGPKIWEVPGVIDDLDPAKPPKVPPAPKSEGEWLEQALKRDPLLKKLPKWARDKAIGALKDGDEKLVDTIIDNVPFGDDEYKQAAKAAAKAILQTLKGRKYKPPPSPPPGMPELEPPSFPKAPGEKIFKLPPIRF